VPETKETKSMQDAVITEEYFKARTMPHNHTVPWHGFLKTSVAQGLHSKIVIEYTGKL
jgi:hypothetical protein